MSQSAYDFHSFLIGLGAPNPTTRFVTTISGHAIFELYGTIREPNPTTRFVTTISGHAIFELYGTIREHYPWLRYHIRFS